MAESTRGDDGYRICPYCAHTHYVEGPDFDAEEDHVAECEECGKKFLARDVLEPVYYASPDCSVNNEEHEFPESPSEHQICRKCDKWRTTEEPENA